MKLLIDDNGHAILENGKPVYEHDDGRKIPFDGAQAFGKIGQLTGENTAYKKRFEEAESKLKSFEGIADPSAAMKALEVVASLDQKKLIDAGQSDKAVSEAIKAVEAKYAPIVAERDTLKNDLYGEKVGGAFARSKLIADKLAIPADLVQARFGQQFKIEDGKTVAYDSHGNKIFSRARPGEVADFDEALEALIDQYPYRDTILKSSGASGGGSQGGGSGAGGSKTLNRAAFDALTPQGKADFAKEVSSGKAVLTD